jgi:alkylation response protein AidB-like acyl-CoA dehydrogenase
MPGFEQSPPLKKMGLHSSPTGELFLNDVRVGIDRLIGGAATLEDKPKASDGGGGRKDAREAARATFASERASVAAMALGIIEQCTDVAVDYAANRVQFGKPIGDFQLIQAKLAAMEVARVNVRNMLFRYLETMRSGGSLSFAEASAIKLYSARAATEVALEAVQVLGGNGYMSEFHVEQLARDAKVLQIYAGTDELQTTAIAKDLLRSRRSA